jgi:transcriptional regulator with XRE-family HTH domain
MWVIKSRALRELRMEKMWSLEQLSEKSGISRRTLVALENGDRPVRLATLDILAKTFGAPPRTIARTAESAEDAKSKSREPSAPPPAPPAPEGKVPPLRAYGPGVTELPKLTRLEELVALEATLPPRAPYVASDGTTIPPLTAKLYQDTFTAYLVHEGSTAHVEGVVLSQRGMSRGQAALCGSRSGAGARFHFMFEVSPGHEVGVTVHTVRVAETARMQRMVNRKGGAIVRVVVAPDEVAEKGGGFEFFMSTTLRPWGLEVLEVVEARAEPEPPTAKTGAKAKGAAKESKTSERRAKVGATNS